MFISVTYILQLKVHNVCENLPWSLNKTSAACFGVQVFQVHITHTIWFSSLILCYVWMQIHNSPDKLIFFCFILLKIHLIFALKTKYLFCLILWSWATLPNPRRQEVVCSQCQELFHVWLNLLIFQYYNYFLRLYVWLS